MKKENYQIPLIEVINVLDDIITTSSPFDDFVDDDDDTEAWDWLVSYN